MRKVYEVGHASSANEAAMAVTVIGNKLVSPRNAGLNGLQL